MKILCITDRLVHTIKTRYVELILHAPFEVKFIWKCYIPFSSAVLWSLLVSNFVNLRCFSAITHEISIKGCSRCIRIIFIFAYALALFVSSLNVMLLMYPLLCSFSASFQAEIIETQLSHNLELWSSMSHGWRSIKDAAAKKNKLSNHKFVNTNSFLECAPATQQSQR